MRRETRAPARLACFAAFSAVALIAFSGVLAAWARLAMGSRLHSHALLVPAVSAWIVWRQRRALPPLCTSPVTAVGLLAVAAALAAAPSWRPSLQPDALTFRTLAILFALAGGWMMFLGRPAFRAMRFPLLFLIFIVPLPDAAVHGMNVALQDGSAWLAHWTFSAMGWPIFRSDYLLVLPGLSLEVAEECSGINSTYALFITSVLAGWMLLRSGWKRALFIGAVLPLGILRNTFRIVSLAVLTLEVDPRFIHSPLHHHGGPIYFALSLVPLFALLVVLHRLEQRGRAARGKPEVP